MKRLLLIYFLLTYSNKLSAQVEGYWYAKEFSKETALFYSKSFLFSTVLGESTNDIKFEVIPLAAASSGELTTLIYKCEEKKREGLVLGFFGTYWNPNGMTYQGYSYKHLDKEKAIEFLSHIDRTIEQNAKYLKDDNVNNNIYFQFEDISVLIYNTNTGYIIRLFWKEFDSTWEKTAFDRSKKRFEKRIR